MIIQNEMGMVLAAKMMRMQNVLDAETAEGFAALRSRICARTWLHLGNSKR